MEYVDGPVEENLSELLATGTLPSSVPSLQKPTGFHTVEESIPITDLSVIGEDW